MDDATTPLTGPSSTAVEECEQERQHLRAKAATRPVINQAMGILMATHGCSEDEAFKMLSTASQRSNRKLRDIAKCIVDDAQDE